MKRKALRVRSEGSIPPYVTEAESRKQHSDSPLCNSLTSAHLELAKHRESEQLRGSPLELLALAVSVLVTYRAVSHAR